MDMNKQMAATGKRGRTVLALLVLALPAAAQTAATVSESLAEPQSKRAFWLIPNYRTSPSLKDYKPLSTQEKFKIATQDSFDRGTIALAVLFAGQGQLTSANPSFGQGGEGYAHYLGTTYSDYLIGDYMTEAVFPTMLHQDPRYFRRGTGSAWGRLGYAAGQIVMTHGDNGKRQFNYSELLGNSTATAISMSYYPDNRTASDGVSKLGVQLGIDAASNIIKEFWPDIERKFKHKSNKP